MAVYFPFGVPCVSGVVAVFSDGGPAGKGLAAGDGELEPAPGKPPGEAREGVGATEE